MGDSCGIFWKWSFKRMHCLSFKKFLNQLCCAVFLDMQSFLMPPNYFDDGYLAIFLRQLSRRGLLLFYCSQKLTEADTPSSFVVQRSFGLQKKNYINFREVWKHHQFIMALREGNNRNWNEKNKTRLVFKIIIFFLDKSLKSIPSVFDGIIP